MKDLLTFITYILGCYYISDLHREPYNEKAKLLLQNLDLTKWSKAEIKDMENYLE